MAHRLLSLLLAPVLAALLFLPGNMQAAQIAANEAVLDPNGDPFEVNLDRDGNLLVSDYGGSQVWRINAATGAYTVYQNLPFATDAHMDATGKIWWVDYDAGDKLGRVSPDTRQVTVWTLTGSLLYGIAIDGGLVWVIDQGNLTGGNQRVLSIKPDTGQLCAYELPDGATADYLVARGGQVWLGDNQNLRIVRLSPAGPEFTYWQLVTGDAYPEGLAVASDGRVWWADYALGELASLEPALNRITAYPVPASDDPNLLRSPEMITLSGGLVWYTDDGTATIGSLDPTQATGTARTLSKTTVAATRTCQTLPTPTTPAFTSRTGILSWSAAAYPVTAHSGAGWTVYQLPSGASPWGIAASRGKIWVVDEGRTKLLTVPQQRVYLPYMTRR